MSTNPDLRAGLFAAAGAYVLWGFLPLYFKLLGDAPPLLILAHRIVWSVPAVLILLAAVGKLGELVQALRRPRTVGVLLVSSLAIAANWAIYIWAVIEARVLEASLGYYINPLISFVFAAIFFGERFNRVQLAALAIAALGVTNQAVIVGEFPWVALTLAVSFATYGAIRKQVAVDARAGFAIEAMWLAPAALIYFALLPPSAYPAFGPPDSGVGMLFMLAGPITAAPLILFAFGARRLRLSTIAILQYIAPTMQFIVGLAFGEAFTPGHAVTFALIWTGVGLFTWAVWRKDAQRTPAPVA